MPTLKLTVEESSMGAPGKVVTNEEKSEVLSRLIPAKLHIELVPR